MKIVDMNMSLRNTVESRLFYNTIIILILVNSVILGMEAYPYMMDKIGHILVVLDDVMIAIFSVELTLYVIAYGYKKCLTDPWFIFDASVILLAIFSFNPAFSSLRALRLFRILRLISVFPNLRKIIQSLINAIPGIGSIGSILAIIMYVEALLANSLYGQAFPDYFGTLQGSLFSLFQILTTEGWPDVVRPILEVYPYAWVFFVIYIFLVTFIVVNLFVGVIVDAMQRDVEYHENEEEKFEALDNIQANLRELQRKIDLITQKIDRK